jgi:hypothetical protein
MTLLDEVAARPFAALHEAMWLQLKGELDEAEAVFRAVVGEPAVSIARRQLDLLLRRQHRWEEALAVIRAHADAHPDNPEIRFHLATSLLRLGRYEEGLPLYESRRRIPAFYTDPQLSIPEWQGEPVSSLLVLDEQGFGDTIQFARYLPLLVARGVRVVLVCRPELAPLMTFPGVVVAPRRPGIQLPQTEAWTPIGSLPLRFGSTPETVPAPDRYLQVPEERRRLWADKLPKAARIGVATRGRPTHPNDVNRSLTLDAAAVAGSFQGAVSLEPETSPLGLRDFADTAAVIERLDLVLSVDTAVAHLAGALGKPCWLLLPHVPEWRWLHDRTDSPWYPSLRLYRQPSAGDWTSVLGQVRRDVAALAGRS